MKATISSIITLLFISKAISLSSQEYTGLDHVSFASASSGLVMKCFWFETANFVFFDLKKLESSGNSLFDFTSKDNTKVYYNFCDNVKQKDCNGAQYQILSHTTDKDCKPFAGSSQNKNTWELLDPKDINKGVKITLNSPDQKCTDKGEKYTVIYEIECDKTAELAKIVNGKEFDTKRCSNTLRFQSKYACPDTNILSVIQFFESKKVIFACVIMIGGLFLLIFGKKLLKVTTYLISVVCLGSLIFVVLVQFTIPSNAATTVIYVVIGIAVLFGGVIGFLITKYKKEVIGLLLGGYSGYLVGTLLYTSVTCRFFPSFPVLVNILTIVVMIAVFVLIAYFFFKHIVILSTSLIGSYGIVRGIGILVGNFPSERVIISLLQNGESDQWKIILTPWVYGYLSGWILLFIGGVVLQYYLNKEEQDAESDLPKKSERLVKSWD